MLDLITSSLVHSFYSHSFIFFVFAVMSVIVVGISKSGFGAGLGMLSLPLIASQSSINEALAILLPLLIAIDLVGMRRFIQNTDWRILKIIVPPSIVGLVLGMIFFTAITPKALTLSIGVFTLLFLIQNIAMSRMDLKNYQQLATSIILSPCVPIGVYFGFYLAKKNFHEMVLPYCEILFACR